MFDERQCDDVEVVFILEWKMFKICISIVSGIGLFLKVGL